MSRLLPAPAQLLENPEEFRQIGRAGSCTDRIGGLAALQARYFLAKTVAKRHN
jgi:hypothetical protein